MSSRPHLEGMPAGTHSADPRVSFVDLPDDVGTAHAPSASVQGSELATRAPSRTLDFPDAGDWRHPHAHPHGRAQHISFEFFKFCTVGASGLVVNLAVYSVMVTSGSVPILIAALLSFSTAVVSNYTWNRLWTFSSHSRAIAVEGTRFLTVSLITLAANLLLLAQMVNLGVGEIPAQALAIVLSTPASFIGNKFWAFRA